MCLPVQPCTGHMYIYVHGDSPLLFSGGQGARHNPPCTGLCRAAYSHMHRRSRDTRAESLLPDVSGPSASGGSMGVLDVARSLSASLQVRTQRGTARMAPQGCGTLKPASCERADPGWPEGKRPAWWCIAPMASRVPLRGRPYCCGVLLGAGRTTVTWPPPAADFTTCRPHCCGAAPASNR